MVNVDRHRQIFSSWMMCIIMHCLEWIIHRTITTVGVFLTEVILCLLQYNGKGKAIPLLLLFEVWMSGPFLLLLF